MEEENKKTEQTPQEATTVGMFLKYTRQNQKKSIEAVSKVLCIRKIYIKAIEESDFKELPPVPYGIGFVRSYAELLGLNAERIVQCYKEESLPKKNDNNSKPIIKKHNSLTMPNRKQIIIGVALVLVLYLITMLIGSKNEVAIEETQDEVQPIVLQEDESLDNQISQAHDLEENTINIVEENYEEPAEKEKNKDAVSTEDVAKKNQVLIKLTGETWLEIKDDKKVYVSGIYQKGFEYEIADAKGIIFSVGRYYNVEVYIDGILTKVARPTKQTKIKLDDFLNH